MAAAPAGPAAPRAAAAAERPCALIVAPHGSYRLAPFVEAAHRRGFDVLIAANSAHALTPAGITAVAVDFANPDDAFATLIAAAKNRRIAAVIGTDDGSTELAARLSQHWGLPHNSPAALMRARRKDLARAQLARAGVRVPQHRTLDLTVPLAPQIADVVFPCVIKPIAMSASRGVIRADDAPALLHAVARVQAIVREAATIEERERLLLESYVPGVEIAIEGLLRAGELEVLAIFDKPDPLEGPFFEETYYITPTRLSAEQQVAVTEAVTAACAAYGLREGPVHAECRLNHEGVWILEVAARTIGGLCGRLLRFGTGLSLEDIVLLHASGVPLPRREHDGGAGVLMIPIPQAGILRRVEGVVAAERVPYVEEVTIQVREGYELVPLPEGASYLGFIFARAPTPALAEQALRDAHACLRVVVAPLWPLAPGP